MCELLRQWRTNAGLTQRALASELRKPHSYVWKVEAGERRIDPIEFAAWCNASGIRPARAIEQLSG
jgi:transcriptional regulator with XRE-family HTH domain